MSIANPPRRHHFAPVFYLKRWADGGFLEQFSRPDGVAVKARRVAPAATGYQDDLYVMPGLSADLAQQVEQKFLQDVDTKAAEVLAQLERGVVPQTSQARSNWTRFVQSLQLRTPADIIGLKQRTRDDWGVSIPKIQETYDTMRRLGDPSTFEEFIEARDPEILDRMALKILTVLIDAEGMGAVINNLIWDVVDLTGSRHDLLASDRAVDQIEGLGHPDTILTVPLGPKRLFVATRRRAIIDRIKRASPTDVVRRRNLPTVCCARSFVWGRDRSQQPYIEKRMGTVHAPTLGERLARRDEETLAAP
jgi:hypothetical protein